MVSWQGIQEKDDDVICRHSTKTPVFKEEENNQKKKSLFFLFLFF